MKILKKAIGVTSLSGLALASALAPAIASANTGAGATVLNVVSVSYTDASGTQSYSANASASVTVNLVEATPTISGSPTGVNAGTSAAQPQELTDANNAVLASGDTGDYVYAITANANGLDSYNVSSTFDTLTNVTGNTISVDQLTPAGAVASSSIASISLGSSVIVAVDNATTIRIPGGSTAGLGANDIVVIDGVDYSVVSFTAGNAASHTNNAGTGYTTAGTLTAEVQDTIVLAANTNGSNTAPAMAAGNIAQTVAEQAYIRVNVAASVQTLGSNGTADFDLSVRDDASSEAAATVDDHTTEWEVVALTITKLVSNGGPFGATATAAPSGTLTYRVTVTNTAGTAKSVVISDAVPAYTTLVETTGNFATVSLVTTATPGPTTGTLTSASADLEVDDAGNDYDVSGEAAGTAAGSALTFRVGGGATDAAGGDVQAGDTYTIEYQVTVD